jgi:C1A family cysteine protease
LSDPRRSRLGWRPDLPDIRDFSPQILPVKASAPLEAGKTVDLRPWCAPIEDQGDLGSCTANAAVGLLEYYEKRAHGSFVNASRLFLYKATRNLMGVTGDTGAYMRDTMKALVLFGAPPEAHYPYDIARFDLEPKSMHYAMAGRFRTVRYYRHDPAGKPLAEVLPSVKRHLSLGFPSMFGFPVYDSFPSPGDGKMDIPYPSPWESLLGGHAVVACGYDDGRIIGGKPGALLIRNSWGTSWGQGGYGWMPYEYVTSGLAEDWWSLTRAEYVNTELFK